MCYNITNNFRLQYNKTSYRSILTMNKEFNNYDYLLVEDKTPLDIIQSMEDYIEDVEDDQSIFHDKALTVLKLLSLTLEFIMNAKDKELATLGVAFALGLKNITNGKSTRDWAKRLKISSGTISFYSVQYRKFLKAKSIDL